MEQLSRIIKKNCFCHIRTTSAHPRSLISAFFVRYIDRIILIVIISNKSVTAQVGLSLTWSHISPKTGFLVTWLN